MCRLITNSTTPYYKCGIKFSHHFLKKKSMKNSRTLLITVMLCAYFSFMYGQPIPTGTRLKDIPAGLKIGTVVGYGYGNTDPNGFIGGLNENQLQTIVQREYNLGTAVCYPKWEAWKTQGVFKYDEFNTIVNWFYNNNKTTIMHMLCGPDIYFPDWFVNGNWNATQQDSLLKNWIYGVMESNNNKNKVKIWNVVNEAIWYNGKYWPDYAAKLQTMGLEADASGLTGVDKINEQHPIYIRKAFEYAADKTGNILELRDNTIEFGGDKSKGFYQLVRHLLNKGVKLDAVGLQCHFDIGAVNYTALKDQIKLYTDLGIQVYLNEMDIGNLVLPFTPAKEEQQKIDFYNVTKVATETGVAGIVLWGITDGNQFWRTNENSLTFTENFTAKPAYYGIQQALQEAVNKYDTVPTGTYIITAKHSGKVLDVRGADTINGAAIWQYTRNNTLAQQWQITHNQGGYHKMIAACSGKALDVSGIGCRDGDLLQQYTFGNGDNQLWKFEKQADGFYKISARHSGKALNVLGISTNDAALIEQWRFVGGDNQLWSVEKIANASKSSSFSDNKDKVYLYPNPANTGATQLSYNNKQTPEAGTLTIIDATGSIIEQRKIMIQNGENRYPINTSVLSAGIYSIQITTLVSKKKVVKKLTVF
jgi:GH35 family endo-1,4-beta-xylanase